MTTPPPLFDLQDATHPAYRNLRDRVSPAAVEARELTEKLWAIFHPCADPHFISEIGTNFHARFWEMYLTVTMLEHASRGHWKVRCIKPGPDILLEHDGRKIWIEAVVATNGQPGRPDTVDAQENNRVPDEQIVMRYTTAIAEKRNKYLQYVAKGIVGPDDGFVIALNGSSLLFSFAEPEIPRILKAVFPIGQLEFVFDRTTGAIVEERHQHRSAVYKMSGSPVPTDSFLNAANSGISALIFSNANASIDCRLGADFIVVHNPLAVNPIPTVLLPADCEYKATIYEEKFKLEQLEGTLRIDSLAGRSCWSRFTSAASRLKRLFSSGKWLSSRKS